MNAVEQSEQFRLKHKSLLNSSEIRRYSKVAADNLRNARKEVMLIESYTGNELTGHLLVTPLFSRSRPTKNQAVFFSNLFYSTNREAVLLIREAEMCSWEMKYHVAFALNTCSFYFENGFHKNTNNAFPEYNREIPLIYSELSWNGMDLLSEDLIFPFRNH
jgi:hypothetical protein